jgi:peptide/nickel transport system substrate-binding protein
MRRLWIAGLAAVALGLTGCTGAGATSAVGTATSNAALNRDPKTLVVAVDAILGDFDMASSYLVNGAVIYRGMYEGLVTLKNNSSTEVVPVLADSWEHNPDASAWTFHLHPGVTFSDGTAMDAAAVKANYTRTIRLELGTQTILQPFLPNPEKQIQVVDPATVRFNLAYPYPRFDLVLAAQYGTVLMSPAVFTKHSKGAKDQGHEWLQGHAVGTGPYLLQEFKADDQAVLVRNPNYWRGWSGFHFDKIIIRAIPEASTRRQLLQSGDVDIAYAGSADDTSAIEADHRFRAGGSKDLEMAYIILGQYGPLASPQARQAMNYLFPYDEFLAAVMKKTMQRASGPFPDLLLTHDPNAFRYPTDVDKARSLLQAAGVKPGTELTYEYYTGFGKEAGVVMQQQLAKVDLRLKLVEKDFDAFSADLTTDRPASKRANMYYWSWWPDYNDPSDYAWPILSKDAAPSACACYNSGYYVNARVSQIIDDGFQQTDQAKLTESFREAQDIMTRTDPPMIAVGQRLEETYLRNDIQGQTFNPLYIQTFDYYALHRG